MSNASLTILALAVSALARPARSVPGQAPGGINPDCEKLLPVALVEKASGRTGIKLMPRDPAVGAGGDCNYAIGGKTMVLLVTLDRFARPQAFQRYKSDKMYQANQKAISGLGEEAFSVDVIAPGSAVVAHKGTTLVALSTFAEMDPRTAAFKGPYVPGPQLIELTRQVLAKS